MGPCLGSFFEVFCIRVAEAQSFGFTEPLWLMATGRATVKPDFKGGTGFNLLRVQFWTPVQKKRVSKRVRKWTRLKSKVVPPGGSSFC